MSTCSLPTLKSFSPFSHLGSLSTQHPPLVSRRGQFRCLPLSPKHHEAQVRQGWWCRRLRICRLDWPGQTGYSYCYCYCSNTTKWRSVHGRYQQVALPQLTHKPKSQNPKSWMVKVLTTTPADYDLQRWSERLAQSGGKHSRKRVPKIREWVATASSSLEGKLPEESVKCSNFFSPNLSCQGALNLPPSLRQERHLKDMINKKSI